jgi:hypothetical protein
VAQREFEHCSAGVESRPVCRDCLLWFIGVLRDRLGQLEDRFFATVFFGSGLLFLGMLFSAAALVGAILMAFAAQPAELIDSATFHFARAAVYSIFNIYMIKMACLFMITTSTVAIYTGFAPGWLAVFRWSFVVFPLWVFLVSLCILVDNLRRPTAVGEDGRTGCNGSLTAGIAVESSSPTPLSPDPNSLPTQRHADVPRHAIREIDNLTAQAVPARTQVRVPE